MKKIEWSIKNQNAKYKFEENSSKESSINISKEIFDFLGGKENGDIIDVTLRKKDFLLAFSKVISNLPLFYWSKDSCQKAEFTSDFFESNYSEIEEHFGKDERIQYKIKLRINDESTTRYYMYRIDGMKNFILRDFLIGENSSLIFLKNDSGELIIVPIVEVMKKQSELLSQVDIFSSSHVSPRQIIYYGVPGSGKSHMINKTLSDKIKDEKQREQQVVRVVFHPEYTNADFVGQILPVMNEGGVDYRFKAGPFSRILKRALKNPGNPYYLIIEEINRGNAAAIFGDLFQLLDRNIDGWSSYPVENLDINSFLRSESDSYNDKSTTSSVKIGAIDFDENTGIRLPPNLSILATMNTSDQNVFTLDNAFQRRWEMKLVENKFDGEESQYQKNAIIEGSSVSWEQFQTEINAKISEVSIENNLSSMVDKRLGCWFVKAVKKGNGSFEIKEEDFKNKILKYLWDDAFKFNREVFETAENFEELLKKVNMENPNFGIFKDLNFKGNQNAGSDSATDGNEQN